MSELKYKLLEIVDSSLERNEISEWEYNCLFKLIGKIKIKICNYYICHNERESDERYCNECQLNMCMECNDEKTTFIYKDSLVCDSCISSKIAVQLLELYINYTDSVHELFRNSTKYMSRVPIRFLMKPFLGNSLDNRYLFI